jgi:hypothetical protein
MLGPKQRMLASYVASADAEQLDAAGKQWTTAEGLLRRLSDQLDHRSQSIGGDHRFSGESAKAAKTAFSHSSTKMSDRADQMRDGAAAFQKAAHAVRQAKKSSEGFAKHAGDQPPQQPPDRNDAAAQRDWKTQNNQFWNHYGDREDSAGDSISALTDNHQNQAAVFAKIHGEPPPVPPPTHSGGNNPISTGNPYSPTHVPGGHLVKPEHTHFDPTDTNHGLPPGHIPTPTPPHDPGPPHNPGPPHIPGPHDPPSDPGIPQGPGIHQTSPFPGGTGLPGTTPGGGVGGAVGGVGAVTGGALGGAAAAGLAGGMAGSLSGGLNGMVPMGGAGGIRGGLSASGVRGIGATSRTGVGSVLGRGTGAGGRAGAGGMSTSGRGGSRGAGSRGSRGRAGARGAGAGAGAGRNGKDKKRQGEERDLFDDGADWIDDEGTAPEVLD